MVKELVATRYELLDRIGVGGVAVVYRAHDVRLDRVVALKVLREELATDPEYLERFQREARMAARLSHPNIAGVQDYGTFGDSAFIAMELVDGESLKAKVRREGPPDQVRGGEVGPAADLYATGAVLYEMLTGRPPFEGKSQIEIALHHLNDAP